ncbi:tetratricopeptide repeat protein [Tautonia sociabilis]|uniref:Tetratricopeptide repeat protein n=1 Tax=Tautonia sociabilis TaxID=2080755 RepID=A0A432MQ68_9BACT|nr:tetratricopeptide repeat protein [Tautonia sociabilis]RUL89582.1 tetratricopeptide repeat protein [Tautonia sociabilis]
MAGSEKSPRRQALEASLAADPTDTFLRYGLAMQCLRDGDVDEGRRMLEALIADHPDDQVAAYQQLGQSYMDEGDADHARAYFTRGIDTARARGDLKAANEMQGFLELLG